MFVLLFRDPDRQWTPQEVADALGIAPQSAGMRLFLLGSAGLLASSGDRDVSYRYTPTPALDFIGQAISDAHADDRDELAATLGGSGGSPATVFADAFRLRKR